MKKWFILMLSEFTFHVSIAQWSTNGTNVYYNSGHVGVGTSTPSSPWEKVLQVYDYNNAALSIKTPVRDWQMVTDATGGFWVYDVTGGGCRLYISSSGNVGIGTTSPTQTLTVNGSIGLQGSGTQKYHVAYYNGGYNIAETGVSDYRFFIRDGGNVGIGTPNPTAKFHVLGGQIIETSGGGANARTLTLKNAGTNQNNFGYYNGSWRSSIQIQNNDATRGLFLAPPENDFGYSIIRSINGGIKFDVGGTYGDVGTNGFTLESNGDSRFNSSAWFSRASNGANTLALSLGQNLNYDYPITQIYTSDNGGSNYTYWLGTRWGHVVTFERNSSIGIKKMVDFGGHDGQHYLQLYSVDGSTPKITLVADGTSIMQGSLAIGTINDHGYKLAVNGNILAQKIRITQTGWPDYVFHPGYKLASLQELEDYIRENRHLPDVPSANEVGEKGLDLGDNQAALLKKIEELTMYVIDLNKKVDQLTEENINLKKLISTVSK